jgi:two-component system, chemotaxis family, chemotaxis protein CheY
LEGSKGMRFNILSVDEFVMTRIELTNMLKNFNVHINSVQDWIEAESVLKEGKQVTNAIVWTINSIDINAFDEIKLIKSKEAYKNIPIIIISKFTDKKYIIKAIESGAVEYIAKPYNEETVLSKMCRVLGIPFEKTEDNTLDEDIITFSFSEMFNREIKAASRGGYPLSLILVTITPKAHSSKSQDEINTILSILNKVIRTNLRETDTSFHYSQDYLIILLPFTDKTGIKAIEKKLRHVYQNHSMIKQKNSGYIFITSSISFPEDGKIKDKLLEKLEDEFDK